MAPKRPCGQAARAGSPQPGGGERGKPGRRRREHIRSENMFYPSNPVQAASFVVMGLGIVVFTTLDIQRSMDANKKRPDLSNPPRGLF